MQRVSPPHVPRGSLTPDAVLHIQSVREEEAAAAAAAAFHLVFL